MSINPYELRNGNCKELIKQLADNTIDAIVTDPPYELGFMGKKWDATGIAYDAELWAECLRVLKPGGHLLAFSGSRTYHRMTVAIEDAGFDIRDQIMWVYGSGFPKSLDISKAIDKAAGAEREVVGTKTAGIGTGKAYGKIVGEREPIATNQVDITAPATDAAKEWNGWGTALKPAHEPICVARKPLIGTVAENVLQYGTGAFNIDGCRVATTDKLQTLDGSFSFKGSGGANETGKKIIMRESNLGRWPANLVHDGSAEVLAGFPETVSKWGEQKQSNSVSGSHLNFANRNFETANNFIGDRGSAARFFYCAKASKRDRDEGNHRNTHPTVKPTDLMRYLCRLVTPPNGLILDPFTGSGSTGKAAILEGFRFLGFEMEPQYIEIATARIEYAIEQKDKQKTEQENTLFGGENE